MTYTVNRPELFPGDNYTTVIDTKRNIRTRHLKCEIIQYKIESNDTNVYSTNYTKSERRKCNHWVYDFIVVKMKSSLHKFNGLCPNLVY
jgi:hypothetical protein